MRRTQLGGAGLLKAELPRMIRVKPSLDLQFVFRYGGPDLTTVSPRLLRATVGDLSAFLIEISHPKLLSPKMAAELQRPQVRLSEDLSWGLGPGIQHSVQGSALWQWGQNIDFQSIIIVYPAHRFGVVVCTNNDLFSPDAARDIAHRALGGKIEAIVRGMRLEYNYRGDE